MSTRPEITEHTIILFEKASVQLHSFYREIGLISKKKPSEPLNKFKLGFINQMLTTANAFLGDAYRPFPDFATFDVDGSLPTASDVVMMLDQYLQALSKFKRDHYNGYTDKWHLSKPVASNESSGAEDDDDESDDDDADDDRDELQ